MNDTKSIKFKTTLKREYKVEVEIPLKDLAFELYIEISHELWPQFIIDCIKASQDEEDIEIVRAYLDEQEIAKQIGEIEP